jgi:hypothetical protein
METEARFEEPEDPTAGEQDTTAGSHQQENPVQSLDRAVPVDGNGGSGAGVSTTAIAAHGPTTKRPTTMSAMSESSEESVVITKPKKSNYHYDYCD